MEATLAQAESSSSQTGAVSGAGLLGALFGKVTTAGAKSIS